MSSSDVSTVEQLCKSVREHLRRRHVHPLATYRFQFNSQFKFQDATALIGYLRQLGVTHVYASPYLRARQGSVHGYDVCSHEELNPEVGTWEEFERFVEQLREVGMGHILDIVPNHMAATCENPWWYDVLENGPVSPYSQYFDIDWRPNKAELFNRVLLPILGEQYGESLETGKLVLQHAEGCFTLRHYDNVLPVGPKTAIPVLEHRLDELKEKLGAESEAIAEFQSIVTALHHLPPQTATNPEHVSERQREKEVIKRRLRELEQRSPEVAEFVAHNVQEFNGQPENPASLDRLDKLLCEQAYRLCHWKAASDEINYRRFFDINELAAICMEHREVFLRAHQLILKLLVDGKVDGVRIDHVDGLLNPTEYLWRLQWAMLDRIGARVYAESGGESDGSGKPRWPEIRNDYMQRICDQLGLLAPRELAASTSSANGNSVAACAFDLPFQMADVRAAGSRHLPLYVLVEKILGADEPLPAEWPVAGTSGYDFLSQLNGVFLEPRGLVEIERNYARFLDESLDFADEVHRCKLLILRVAMSSELQMLAHRLNRISEQHRRSRDFTVNSLRYALREILACFPVYRTYPGPGGISDRDRRFINLAVARAKRRNPAMDSALFDFIRSVLLFEFPDGLTESQRNEREVFAGRFQQVTSPVMAKGLEDTAFYVVCPLLSVNEVGSHPPHAIVRIEQFHQENASRQQNLPASMLCTSTHDTKRSEDVRARLNVLTEIPPLFRKAVNQWARLNRRFRVDVEGEAAPSRNDEYVFYQSLIGIWPLVESEGEVHDQLIGRLQQYMEKATREAKMRTSWINPNHQYDAVMREFVAKVLEKRRDNRFLKEFARFIPPVIDWGLWNALSQLTLKLLSPGVPDIYQGQEVWDFSLVDPDNRRPVNFAAHQAMLRELQEAIEREGRLAVTQRLRANLRDPKVKLFATWQGLQLRQSHAHLFQHGDYQPLGVDGEKSDHVCAFAWQASEGNAGSAPNRNLLVVAVPRWIAKLDLERPNRESEPYPLSPEAWGETRLQLQTLPDVALRHAYTGERISVENRTVRIADLFKDFPVAALEVAE